MRFEGKRTGRGRCKVTADGTLLDPRHDLYNHSPDGFEWGYGGSGPAQLALAILAKYTNDEFAQATYQDFKREFIQTIETDTWTLESKYIMKWAQQKMSPSWGCVADDIN